MCYRIYRTSSVFSVLVCQLPDIMADYTDSSNTVPRVIFDGRNGRPNRLSFTKTRGYSARTEGGNDGFYLTEDLTNAKPSSPKHGLTLEEARLLHTVQDQNAKLNAAIRRRRREILSSRVSDAIQRRGPGSSGSDDADALVESPAARRAAAVHHAALASKIRRERSRRSQQPAYHNSPNRQQRQRGRMFQPKGHAKFGTRN